MLIRRWRRGLLFPAAMDLDQPLKCMCALAALFYPTFRHCSSSTIPHISVRTVGAMQAEPSRARDFSARRCSLRLCFDEACFDVSPISDPPYRSIVTLSSVRADASAFQCYLRMRVRAKVFLGILQPSCSQIGAIRRAFRNVCVENCGVKL
jgi:hypothetical protein